MDEWENRKSMKQNKKYSTGHTYRRVSNRDVIRLNKDQNIKIEDDIHNNFSSSYKGISVNKNKNWLLKDTLSRTTNDQVFFDKEPKVQKKVNNKNNKKTNEIPAWDNMEPIVKVEKDHSNNKLVHNYTFYNPQSLKTNEESDESIKKKSKVLSRKAQRNLKMKNLDVLNENNYKETIKFSIDAPLETLKMGKCWKHPIKVWKPSSTFYTDDNKYAYSHFCEVISTSKHNTQKKQLALDDPRYVAKEYLKYDQMKYARTAITYLSSYVNDNDVNEMTRFRPLVGLESYVDREQVMKTFTKEFHNVTTSTTTTKSVAKEHEEEEEDGFYVCTSSDWQEPEETNNTVCQICLDDSNELVKLDGCEHEACRKCWRQYVRSMLKSFELYTKSNLNEQSIICCVHQGCSNSLSMELITKILSPFEIKKYIKFYCDLKILNNQAYVECKRENCKRLILKTENSQISVCKCNYMICNKCHLEAHYPMSCEDAITYKAYFDVTTNNNSTNKQQVQLYMQGKFCPKCHMFIEKDGGCEHMHCFCKYDFCWECLHDYEKGHLCKPGSKVRLTTLSMFSMDKIIKTKLIGVIQLIESILLDSGKRLAAADKIYHKLKRLNPIDVDKIRFDCSNNNNNNNNNEENEDENDTTQVELNLANQQQSSLKLIYFFLRKISNDIEQFNTICKYAAFEVLVKKNEKIGLHVYTAVQLCDKINKMFLQVENWKQLNQLFTIYKKLMLIIEKINIPAN